MMTTLESIYSEYKQGSANLESVAARHNMTHAELLDKLTKARLSVKKTELYKAELDQGKPIEDIAADHGVQPKTVKTFLRQHQYDVPRSSGRDSCLFVVSTRLVHAYRALGVEAFHAALQELAQDPALVTVENIGIQDEQNALALGGVLSKEGRKAIDTIDESAQVHLPSGKRVGRSLIVRQAIERAIVVAREKGEIGEDQFAKPPGWEPRPFSLRQGKPIVPKLKEPTWRTSATLPLYLRKELETRLIKPRGRAHIENEAALSRFTRDKIDKIGSIDRETLAQYAPLKYHVRTWAKTIGSVGLVLYECHKATIESLKAELKLGHGDVISAILMQALKRTPSTLRDWDLWRSFVDARGNPEAAAKAHGLDPAEFVDRLNAAGYIQGKYEAWQARKR